MTLTAKKPRTRTCHTALSVSESALQRQLRASVQGRDGDADVEHRLTGVVGMGWDEP